MRLTPEERKDLKPVFRHLPRWVLLIILIVLGLPVHLVRGIVDGFSCWWSEIKNLIE